MAISVYETKREGYTQANEQKNDLLMKSNENNTNPNVIYFFIILQFSGNEIIMNDSPSIRFKRENNHETLLNCVSHNHYFLCFGVNNALRSFLRTKTTHQDYVSLF